MPLITFGNHCSMPKSRCYFRFQNRKRRSASETRQKSSCSQWTPCRENLDCLFKRLTDTGKKLDMLHRLMDGSAWALKKGAANCEKPRIDARSRRAEDSRMRLLVVVLSGTMTLQRWSGNPLNWSILVMGGKETNWDSLISGERKGKSPNRTLQGNL